MDALTLFKQNTTRAAQVLMLGHAKKFSEVAVEMDGVVFCDYTFDDLWFNFGVENRSELADKVFSGRDVSNESGHWHNTFVDAKTDEKIEYDFTVYTGGFRRRNRHGVEKIVDIAVATMMVDDEVVSTFYYVE